MSKENTDNLRKKNKSLESENIKLKQRLNILQEIFEASITTNFLHDYETGKLIDINKTVEKLYGYSKDEILNMSIDELSLGETPYSKKEVEELFERVKKEKEIRFEWRGKRKDGSLFWTDNLMKVTIIDGKKFILVSSQNITERKKVEEAIIYRNNLEKLIFCISGRFINILPEEVDENIIISLSELCKFSNADTVLMYLYSLDKGSFELKYSWFNNKADAKKIMNCPQQFDDWYFKQINKNKEIRISSLSKLADESAEIKKVYQCLGINSLIQVGLFSQGVMIGFYGLLSNKNNRVWHDDEVNLLKILGEILINAIQRKQAVTALSESEQTHREIYNATSEAILILELNTGKVLDVNKAMLDLFDFSYDEAINTSLEILCLPENEDKKSVISILKAASDKPQIFEWRSKKKDGTLFWSEISLKQAEIHGRKCILAVIRDVDERKKSQRLLAENEEKYRILVEGQSDLVIKINTEAKIMFASPFYCDLFGKKEEEVLGKKFIPLIQENDMENTENEMAKLFKPPYTSYMEQRAMTKFGWRWLAWNNKAIIGENNEVTGIIGVGRDITYQKEVETALRENEDRFRTLIQHLSDMVLVLDQNSVISFATPSTKIILGYDEGDLLGRKASEFIHPDDRSNYEKELELVLKNKNDVLPVEIRIKHAKGGWVYLELLGNNMLDQAAVRGIVITCRDITERKQLEKRILDAILKTEEKERERFAKNLHDDLGPLLSSIKMYLGMLSGNGDNEKRKFILAQLQDIVKEAISTTKDVSNDLSPHILNNYGLVSAIESFIKKISSQIKVNFTNLIDNNRYTPTLETSIYRVIKELINNTIKHAHATKIDLKIDEEKSMLYLSYSDDGIGLPEDVLKKGYSGGMGLSNIISRSKSLNGNYKIFSKKDEGFQFELTIPVIQET